ncbi:MAG: hypothetical protein SGPRY_009391, partial [Prymnesium sp.]
GGGQGEGGEKRKGEGSETDGEGGRKDRGGGTCKGAGMSNSGLARTSQGEGRRAEGERRRRDQDLHGCCLSLDVDRLHPSEMAEASSLLSALPQRLLNARKLSSLLLLCSHPTGQGGTTPTFNGPHPSRRKEGQQLLRSALRHVAANSSLLSLQLSRVPCPVRQLCCALGKQSERALQSVRLCHLELSGWRLGSLLRELARCSFLNHLGLMGCGLTDQDAPQLVWLIQTVRSRRKRVDTMARANCWRLSLRSGGGGEGREVGGGREGEEMSTDGSTRPIRLELAANALGDFAASLLCAQIAEDDTLQAKRVVWAVGTEEFIGCVRWLRRL